MLDDRKMFPPALPGDVAQAAVRQGSRRVQDAGNAEEARAAGEKTPSQATLDSNPAADRLY